MAKPKPDDFTVGRAWDRAGMTLVDKDRVQVYGRLLMTLTEVKELRRKLREFVAWMESKDA